MGVLQIKQKLIGANPSVTGLVMRYQQSAQVFTVTVNGKLYSVTVEPQSTEDEIVAAILDGVKKQEASNDGTTEPLHG